VSLDPSAAEAIAAEYSLEANRRRTAELAERLRRQGVDLEVPASAHLWDERTLLHWNHLRTSEGGGWRERATPRELAVLAGVCGPWLVARGYERDAAWALPGLQHLSAELGAALQALAEARAGLARQVSALEEVRRLGPVALGLARRFHRLSVGLPWLSGAIKRLLASWGTGASRSRPSEAH
jgi:hypothetical protein